MHRQIQPFSFWSSSCDKKYNFVDGEREREKEREKDLIYHFGQHDFFEGVG